MFNVLLCNCSYWKKFHTWTMNKSEFRQVVRQLQMIWIHKNKNGSWNCFKETLQDNRLWSMDHNNLMLSTKSMTIIIIYQAQCMTNCLWTKYKLQRNWFWTRVSHFDNMKRKRSFSFKNFLSPPLLSLKIENLT